MTGAATTTLSSLLPKSSAVHAWAITRSSPLKSPMGNVTRAFALIVQYHRLRLLGDDRHVVNRRFAAAFF